MKEMKSIKRCLALLLALTMVISGMTIPEKKATAAEDTTVANEATEANDASVEYVAQIGEQSYATFAEALGVANASPEAVTIQLLADIKLTDSIEINNTNGIDITIDGTNNDARYKLEISSDYKDGKGNPSIQLHQKSGNITFQNIDIEHGGSQMLLRLGENTYAEGSDRDLTVNMTNMNIISTSKYEYCLMATQALGKFNINMTDVGVDWNKDSTYSPQRAFLRCGNDTNGQTVNLTTTRCTIDVSDTTQTKGMHIMSKVSGEFKLYDTDILVPGVETPIYTNGGTATITPDADSRFVRVYKVATADEFTTAVDNANASAEDVIIKLVSDIQVTNKKTTINNVNGKNITIDGANGDERYTLTLEEPNAHAILVHQTSGMVTMQNLRLIHKEDGQSMLMRIGEGGETYTHQKNVTVKLQNMYIESNTAYTYCLMSTQDLGQFDVEMMNVDVNWNGAYGHDQRAFLRCGNGSDAQKVNFTATGCKIDVSNTTKTQGMYICGSVDGAFNLNNTDITIPGAASAIYTMSSSATATITPDADCTFTRVYKVGDDTEFTTAVTSANASTEDVIIKLVADIQVENKQITINNTNGKNITIDGANGDEIYTLTLKEPNAHAILVHQASGMVTMQNLRLMHEEDGSYMLMRLGEGGEYNHSKNVTVKLQNMYIESNAAYPYCLMSTQDSGQFDIVMTDVDVKWTGDADATNSNKAFLRCADGNHDQTVNLTATRCTINVADAAGARGMYIFAKVFGTFTFKDTNIITYDKDIYTNSGSVTFSVDDDCEFSTNGGIPVAEIGEQTYLTFKKALKDANASTEDVTIKLLADIALTDVIEIKNANGKNITFDGANGNERYTLTMTTSVQSILVSQKSGNITFQNMNIVHNGTHMLLRLGNDKYTEETKKTLKVNLKNMDIKSSSTYPYCLVGTQDLGQFDIEMTNVDVDWSGDDTTQSSRAFLRCGKGINYAQTVNLTATGCTIDVSDTTQTQGMYICAGVSGTFELNNTNIIKPDGAATYTNQGSATVTYVYEVNTAEEFKTAVENAKTFTEHVKIKLLADIALNDVIEIKNANGKNITFDGANGNERYTLTMTTLAQSILVSQKSGNITFQNMNIVHNGTHMLLRLGNDKYTETTKKTLKVNLENMDIKSSSTYPYCLVGTQDLGQFDIEMTNVDVDWSGDDTTQSSRAFLRCGKSINYAQTVNLTATGCTIDVSKTTKTQGLYICEGVSGTFTFKDTDIITPAAATAMYTNNGVVEFEVDDDCNGIPDGCKTKYEQYDNVTAFKTSEGYIAPSTIPTGYVFAGWYTDKSCTAEHVLSTDATTTSAYAKFVPDHVIEVKAQISANLLDGVSEGEKGAIRFATTVDSLDYQAVGFEYTITNATGEQLLQGQTTNTGVVYKKLYAVGTKDGEPLSYTPEIEFCAESEYFKAITFTNISSTLFDAKITVTPFWITLNGTKVYGEAVTKTVQQGIDGGADSEGNLVGGSESTESVYTNRLVLLADAHYMTDDPVEGVDAPSAGMTLGYTQVQKMSFITEDITKFDEQKTVNGVLVLGDLASDDYGYSNRTENYVQKFKEDVMVQLPGVTYAIPGNHDVYSNDIWNQIFGYDRQYSVPIGDAAFIMLDTYAPADGEEITNSGSSYKGVDIEWLKTELEKYPEERIFLCCHNYAKGQNTANDAELKELIKENNRIVCMFRGHSHSNGTYTPDSLAGIPLIDVGGYAYNVKTETQTDSDGNTITITDYNKFDASWAWGYQVLEWNDEEVHVYHVKPARTYTGSNGTFNFAGAIEDDIIIKLR